MPQPEACNTRRFAQDFLIGRLATEAFVVVPFELIKIRLQDKAQAGRYTGMIDCFQKIVRQEGLLAM